MIFAKEARFSVERGKQAPRTRGKSPQKPGNFCPPLLRFTRFNRFGSCKNEVSGIVQSESCICPSRRLPSESVLRWQSTRQMRKAAICLTRHHRLLPGMHGADRNDPDKYCGAASPGPSLAGRVDSTDGLAGLGGCKLNARADGPITGRYTSTPANAICSNDL